MTEWRRPLQAAWALSLILVTYLSLRPGTGDPMLFAGLDKLQHAAAYAWLALLALFCGARIPRAALFLVAWGLLMELAQRFAPMREPSLADAAANACGVCLGLLLGQFLKKQGRAARESGRG